MKNPFLLRNLLSSVQNFLQWHFPSFLFGRKKLLLAFEYGALIANVAKEQGVELDAKLIEKAERMIESEFAYQTATKLATNIVPNLLSVFELDITK